MKPNKRGLGIVFQSYALFPHMSVADNVGFGLEMRNIDKAERNERVREALALVRLDTPRAPLSDANYPAVSGNVWRLLARS